MDASGPARFAAHLDRPDPYSRTHESEADASVCFSPRRAGDDSGEAVGIWQRMDSAGGGNQGNASTHPSHGTRMGKLEQHRPEAMAGDEKVAHSPRAPRPSPDPR